MTNNTPDYKDNLYFEEKKMDCKNCPFTDEYCASGDCNKIQAKDVACNKILLTEQCRRGELPEGWYWVKRVTWSECINMLYYWSDTFLDGDVPVDNDEIMEVLAPVPSYEEWKASYNCMLENEVLRLKNAQLKELLKEVKDYLPEFETPMDILAKIDEVLK